MSSPDKIKQKVVEMMRRKQCMDRKEYFHQYYLEHREQILESRKKKYAEEKRRILNGSEVACSKVQTQEL